MPLRLASPAVSETEFDISRALFQGFHDNDDVSHTEIAPRPQTLPPNLSLNMLDVDDEEDDADGDGAYIIAQQTLMNRKASNLKGRTVKKGGGFQAMGLNAKLLKAIARKGFSVPTPIQRKTIPPLLDDQDVVGMARTGSGKTAAFVIPMIEKLKTHNAKVGARGLILSPSRELALQTLKVVKELGRGTDLRSVLLVGGDSLEEQFGYMTGNPDIIIATPGRFLHLKVEMGLDLSSIRYVVFDEADRLFEMGFSAQLTEILHCLPDSRQTLLFSATLPKSLVEFARAGLQEPKLVRLDAESKISPDLQSAFFTVKSAEKEGALLHILQDVIKLPPGETEAAKRAKEEIVSDKNPRKRKRSDPTRDTVQNPHEAPDQHSTIVFVATKHHVDYVSSLLRESGYAVSYAYGSLDQTARKTQVHNFRTGVSNILVVTDVAARGIDIPVLENVINYDFPSQPKIFVHRVGRTARAGRQGWSYSLVRDSDAPYLLDLQLFLGRPLILGRSSGPAEQVNYTDYVVIGGLLRDALARSSEWVAKLLSENVDLELQRSVAHKGEKLYMRTRNSASSESAKRARDVVASEGWMTLHSIFNNKTSRMEIECEKMLTRIGSYKPQETIFEIGGRRTGKSSNDEAAYTARKLRSAFESKKSRRQPANGETIATHGKLPGFTNMPDNEDVAAAAWENGSHADVPVTAVAEDMSCASDSELEVTFSYPDQERSKSKSRFNSESNTKSERSDGDSSFQNEYYMSYAPNSHSLTDDRAYGVHSGSNSNFVEASRSATMDLAGDELARGFGEPRSIMRWDKRHKKYVSRHNDEDGSKGGGRLVRGESGTKISATFRTGRFEAWKKGKRISRMPRVGENETSTSKSPLSMGNAEGHAAKRYRHRKVTAPKAADRWRGDYEKQKKKEDVAKQRGADATGVDGMMSAKNGTGKGKSELRTADAIRKARTIKEKKKEKNARPSKKRKKAR